MKKLLQLLLFILTPSIALAQDKYLFLEYQALTSNTTPIAKSLAAKLKPAQKSFFQPKTPTILNWPIKALNAQTAAELCEEHDTDYLFWGRYLIIDNNIAINHWIYNANTGSFSRFLQYGKKNQVKGALAFNFKERFKPISRSFYISENIPKGSKLAVISNLDQTDSNFISMSLLAQGFTLSATQSQDLTSNSVAPHSFLDIHTKEASILSGNPMEAWQANRPTNATFKSFYSEKFGQRLDSKSSLLSRQSTLMNNFSSTTNADYLLVLIKEQGVFQGRAINLAQNRLVWWHNALDFKPANHTITGSYLMQALSSYEEPKSELRKIVSADLNKPASIAFITFQNETNSEDYSWISASLPESIFIEMDRQFQFSRVSPEQAQTVAQEIFKDETAFDSSSHLLSENAIKQFKENLQCDFLVVGFFDKEGQDSVRIHSNLINLNLENADLEDESVMKIDNNMFFKLEEIAQSMTTHISAYAEERKTAENIEQLVALSADEIKAFEAEVPMLIHGPDHYELKQEQINQ